MIQEISVYLKPQFIDGKAAGILNDIHEFLAIDSITKIKCVKKYYLEGLNPEEALKLAQSLFAEVVWQDYKINQKMFTDQSQDVEIAFMPGIMNPEVASIITVAKDSGFANLKAADIAWHYFFYGDSITKEEIITVVNRLLMNKTTQQIVTKLPETFIIEGTPAKTVIVPIRETTDEKLMDLSQHTLFLNLEEMKIIQKYFQKLGRDPTDCELEMLAQTWSEHCGHKTFKAKLIIDGQEKTPLFQRLKEATQEINRDDIVSAYKDNSGVIDFFDEYAICGKVETHNSPSAIEPYGGAATGSGGVFRDIMGTGLGAKTVLSTDIFCVAPPNIDQNIIPKGCLHPRYLLQNVVRGVRDYGNCIGVPTYNGSVHFHNDFRAKPSIIVGAYGLIKKSRAQKGTPRPGDYILAIGGRTGRDGIHGATFSSAEMTEKTEQINSSAVQIGNPVEEKRAFDACLAIAEKEYAHAITDCGAGGFSSAVGEMSENTGAEVQLEKCPLKYTGLAPWEIWVSESQERMVLAIDPDHIEDVLAICKRFNVEGTIIGKFTANKKLHLTYDNETVLDLDLGFIHEGLPQRVMEGHWEKPNFKEPEFVCPDNLGADLKKALTHLNVCSKEPIVKQYDHTVQAGSVLPAFSGKDFNCPNDAAIIEPLLGSGKGLAVAHGLNPILNRIDPYYGSLWAILEAVSNLVATGVNPKDIALIDNFIWPFPDKEELGSLDRAIDACAHASKILKMPFISGKDSLSSTYRGQDGLIIKIPPVLCISAFSKVEDICKTTSSPFKKAGNKILLVGNTKKELGGSVYYENQGEIGNSVPQPDITEALKIFQAVFETINSGQAVACHDLSEGGLGTAITEMCYGYNLGVSIDLEKAPHNLTEKRADYLLFAESSNRFLLEIPEENVSTVKEIFAGLPVAVIGETTTSGTVEINYEGKKVVNEKIDDLRKSWEKPMREVFIG
jgi:phosphoribosylformylglycinamidine synthase